MDMDKYIGRLLDNRYEIQEVIGMGGMAVVYKARCHRLNRLVAIKILKDEYSQDEEFRRRFHAESQAVAMLSHPNIVSVYDVSTSSDADYIVMELIDGITLKQYMEKKGVLNWKETLHFAIQIAKALEHAHSRGIVHRDIKPHNVMVLKNGSVKVADFGIARVMSKGNTLTKEALGSVHYISPEQAKGGRVDNRSDLYSLGVVMYEMMAGRPPFDGESPVAVAIQHINGGAPMPSTLNPNIPGGLEQIIMKAMAHEPNDRYDSATAMLYDMDEFRKDPSILFDYNVPTVDVMTELETAATQTIEIPPHQLPRTTAERVAADRTPPPRVPRDSGRVRAERAAVSAGARRNTGRAAPVNPDTGRAQSRARSEAARRRREEEERRSRMTMIAIVVCGVVALIAIGILLFTLLGNGVTSDATIPVPALLGKDYESLPKYQGLTITLREKRYSEDYEKGQIIFQTPNGGDMVAKGTEVFVDVSLGKEPEVKTMQNLLGLDQAAAENFLKGQNLVPLIREENSPTEAKGKVVRTEPAENEELKDGQTVTIWVSSGRMEMPNVTGVPVKEAREELAANGFHNVEEKEVDSEEDKGTVVRQSVTYKTEVDVKTNIVLEVSSGKVREEVPNVVGRDVDTAKAMLNAAGFKKVEVTSVDSSEPKDTVLRQSVDPNTKEDVTVTITLEVSSGKVKAEVPGVTGRDVNTAKKMLSDAGFKKVEVTHVDSDEPKDTVVRQSVEANTKEDVTTTITLEVSNGPTTPPTDPKVTKTVIFGLVEGRVEPYKVTVKLGDEVIHEQTVPAGESAIELTLTGSGVVYYDIYIDGQYFAPKKVDFAAK